MRKDGFLHEGVFQIKEDFLLGFTPLPEGVFTYEIDKRLCSLREVFDETTIVVSKAKELADTFNIIRDISGFDNVNLFLRHVDVLI